MELRGNARKVVLTGATGFVGGRLVEALVTNRGVNVTALVRDYAKVARVARFGIPMVRADLLEPESFASTLKGADIVFHCGYGGNADEKVERHANLDGTLNLAREAVKQGVKRFVHVSTMSIYGHDLPPTVDEDTPPKPTTGYGRVKLEIEEALKGFSATSGLDMRMVRPTKVFGPHDYNFTVPTTQKMLENRLWLIENGTGIVSPNYVDNLVAGLLLAAEKEGVNGGAYIMADGYSLTWAEFFRHFAGITGVEPVGSVTKAECEAASQAGRKPPSIKALVRATLLNQHARELYPKIPAYRFIRTLSSQTLVDRTKRSLEGGKARQAPSSPTAPRRPQLPSMGEYRDYTRRGAFSIERAQRELGYRPRIGIEQALHHTEAWLRFAGVLPSTHHTGSR